MQDTHSGLELGPGSLQQPHCLSDLLLESRRLSEPAASSRVIISRLSLESWTVWPRVLLAAGARGPAATSSWGGEVCAPDAPPPASHVCVAGRRGPGSAPHRAAPGWASGSTGRDPAGRDPQRSLGPAGRLRGAGVRETIICSVVMKTATVGRGSISQARLLTLTIFLVPGPTRTVWSFIATVKAGSCQNSARAHSHPRGGWVGDFF